MPCRKKKWKCFRRLFFACFLDVACFYLTVELSSDHTENCNKTKKCWLKEEKLSNRNKDRVVVWSIDDAAHWLWATEGTAFVGQSVSCEVQSQRRGRHRCSYACRLYRNNLIPLVWSESDESWQALFLGWRRDGEIFFCDNICTGWMKAKSTHSTRSVFQNSHVADFTTPLRTYTRDFIYWSFHVSNKKKNERKIDDASLRASAAPPQISRTLSKFTAQNCIYYY